MVNYVKGLDISIIQGTVDFNAVAASGIQFIIARCGVGNSSIDSDYASNIVKAKAAGLYTLAYHFVYPLPTIASQPLRDPIKQAQYHFNAVQGVRGCCDLEWPTSDLWQKWGCSAQQINDWGLAYLAEYSRLDGRPMIVYTYPNFSQTVNLSAEYGQYPLWIASYEPTPEIPAPWTNVGWTLWQTTGGGGHLPNGAPVDTDVCRDLSLWGGAVVQPDPFPPPVLIPVPPPAPLPAPPVQVASTNPFAGIIAAIMSWINNFGK